jgi:hypothetical protein
MNKTIPARGETMSAIRKFADKRFFARVRAQMCAKVGRVVKATITVLALTRNLFALTRNRVNNGLRVRYWQQRADGIVITRHFLAGRFRFLALQIQHTDAQSLEFRRYRGAVYVDGRARRHRTRRTRLHRRHRALAITVIAIGRACRRVKESALRGQHGGHEREHGARHDNAGVWRVILSRGKTSGHKCKITNMWWCGIVVLTRRRVSWTFLARLRRRRKGHLHDITT